MTDQNTLDSFTKRAEAKAANHAAKLQEEVSRLRQEIEKLMDEKEELARGPFSREETVALAKSAHRESVKRLFLDGVLLNHLKDCQNRRTTFLQPEVCRVHLVEEDLFKFIPVWITEADIEQAGRELPNIGTPAPERNARIAKIEKEIRELEKKIESILNE